MKTYDALIVGAGHNGLVCANYLAKAGLSVCVVERQPFVGGAAISREVWPGYKVSVASYWMSLLQPKVMLDLELLENGLEVISVPPSFQPFDSGNSLVFWPDETEMVKEIARFSAHDAEAYPRFVAHMDSVVPFIRRLIFETPVDPSTGKFKDLARTMAFAWRMKDIGGKLYDVWDLLTMPAYDFLKHWFESEELLTAFGCYTSAAGGPSSPRAAASAYVLLRPLMRDPNTEAGGGGLVRGGMGSISETLLKVAKAKGVDVITGKIVKKVDIKNGKACGVHLEDGTHIAAKLVVSNAGAKRTYFDLIGKEHLTEKVVEGVGKYRTESIMFKINLACNALPRWTQYDARGLSDQNPGSITIADNVFELEQATFEARNGIMAQKPYLWITTPSAFDNTVAPAGKHVVQILGGQVPYQVRGREWNDALRQELLDIVIGQIERYAPGFGKEVIHAQILTPKDIEEMFWLQDGNVQHGDLTLDQVFFRRPIAHYAAYRTPITNLYSCGASNHPGGGVTGVPGHNAAREILRDLGKSMPSRH